MVLEEWLARACSYLGVPAENAGDTPPRVVLVGAYNTAKTTLLRRLLADHDCPIPDWARVSAREETSSVGLVSVAACTLVDTPGLEALSQWHADESLDALMTADAVAVLTTSNLMSTGPSRRADGAEPLRPVDVLTGRIFAEDGQGYAPPSLAVFITRFDEAGPDPVDFPQHFEEFRERKLSELRALLHEHLPPGAPLPTLAAIAPDPFGRTRNADPRRGTFDPYRGWDGMESVEEWLQEVRQHSAELSTWRQARRVIFELTGRQQRLTDQQRGRREALATLDSDVARARLRAGRCAREREAAQARLSAAIDTAVHAAPAPQEASFRPELRSHLVKELGRWADATAETLRSLMAETQADLSAQTTVPSGAESAADDLMRYLDSGSGEWQTAKAKLRAGIKVVGSGLGALSAKDDDQPSVANPGGLKLPGLSPERLSQLGLLLTVAEAMLSTADSEGAPQRVQERAAHRKKLLGQASLVARAMFVGPTSPEGWEGMFTELQSATDGAVQDLERARASASQELENEERLLVQVRQLLASRPLPASSVEGSVAVES